MRARKENKSSFLVCLVGAEHKLNDTPVATQGDRLPSINVERDATDTFETKKVSLHPPQWSRRAALTTARSAISCMHCDRRRGEWGLGALHRCIGKVASRPVAAVAVTAARQVLPPLLPRLSNPPPHILKNEEGDCHCCGRIQLPLQVMGTQGRVAAREQAGPVWLPGSGGCGMLLCLARGEIEGQAATCTHPAAQRHTCRLACCCT